MIDPTVAPASIALLPLFSLTVSVGPPLLARVPIFGSAVVLPPPVGKHVPSLSRLLPSDLGLWDCSQSWGPLKASKVFCIWIRLASSEIPPSVAPVLRTIVSLVNVIVPLPSVSTADPLLNP